jgi:hypothetical protein
MRNGLLLIERMIVESLLKKDRNVYELAIDTGLNETLLLNVIPNLLMKNILHYGRGIYKINRTDSELWLSELGKSESIKEEVRELFASLLNQFFTEDLKKMNGSTSLKVQKVWLNDKEQVILNSHLKNLDLFFTGVKDNRKGSLVPSKTHEEKVVIWGISSYAELLEGSLKAI